MRPDIKIKRAYEEASEADGYRVLVDRLWPRGIKKEALRVDEWLKDMAPSRDLRRWYGHKLERWPEFRKRYMKELEAGNILEAFAAAHQQYPVITLVYAAKDAEHSNARVLQECLREVYG
jgi:uncharacterized protein YeaO (DUF488 family)